MNPRPEVGWNRENYALYECDLASIRLPPDFTIDESLPWLYASHKEEVVAIEAMPEDIQWDGAKEEMSAPLMKNHPQSELSVVRQRHVNSPYSGGEKIVQLRVLATNDLQYHWDILLEDGECRAIIGISGPDKFTDHEEKWARVIESFRFK